MRRERVYRGTVEGTCEQCFSTGELQVFDSYWITRRWLVFTERSDWSRSWVCPFCEYAFREPLDA